MSYCVHCGVELADYEKSCPLCHTPVIDPHVSEKDRDAAEPLYIDELTELPGKKLNWHFITIIIGLVLLIPFIVVVLLDAFLDLKLDWGFYVLGAEVCFWCFVLLPVLLKDRLSVYVYIVIDTVAALLYLFLIALLTKGLSWYLPLAVPFTLAVCLIALIIAFILSEKKAGRLSKTGWTIIALSLLPALIDMTIRNFKSGNLLPSWSWYATVPMLVLGIAVTICSHNISFIEWVRRKMFI